MREIGLLHPIVVTYPDEDTTILVAGRHRLEAARSLGWVLIHAFNAVELTDFQRELIEIDENLCRSELRPADRAVAITRRKAIYILLHPETELGAGTGGRAGKTKDDLAKMAKSNDAGAADRFTKDTASKTGISERTIRRNAERGRKIGEANLKKIANTSPDSGSELDALAKLDPQTRDDLTARAAAGEDVSAREIIQESVPVSDADIANAHHRNLMNFCAGFKHDIAKWIASDVPKEAKDMMHNGLMLAANELMELAQKIDGR